MNKNTIVTTLLAALAVSLPAAAALKKGQTAPDFSTQASLAGKEFAFSLASALKKGPVVVYFYPSAFTKGCNIEAHEFAVNKEKFDAAGATIIGVSHDDIGRLTAFSADPEYCAGKFPVASDADGKIAAAYDLKATKLPNAIKDSRGQEVSHPLTERTTFVIAPDSSIVATLSQAEDKISPAEHVTRSLAVVNEMKAAKTE
jgi:peroxiredoxin